MTGPARRVAVNALLDRLDRGHEKLSITALGDVFGVDFWTVLNEFAMATHLRDNFAVAALQVYMEWGAPGIRQSTQDLDAVATAAYVMADAAMRARKATLA